MGPRGTGTRCRHLKVGARRALSTSGWQFTDAVLDTMAHAVGVQSSARRQHADGANRGGGGIPDRFCIQPRISARVRRSARDLAPYAAVPQPRLLSIEVREL